MKKLITTIALFSFVAQVNAQSLKDSLALLTPQQLGNYHLQKSRDAKVGALLLGGIGVGIILVGGSISASSETTIFDENFDDELNTMMTLAAVGTALVIVSLPIAFSSISHKKKSQQLLGTYKKKKALSIDLKSSKIPNGYAHQAIPLRSLGLNLSF